MPTYNVVSVPYPYVERPITKRRPAVVMSNDDLRKKNGLVWVCMITSEKNAGWYGDLKIADLDKAGLKHPSVIRPSKVATVEVTNINVIGQLDEAVSDSLKKQLSSYL